MTDEQILNALKACGDSIAICDGCPYEGRIYCSLLAKQDIIARFEQLKAENAALREQISKMIMPPCTLGDTLYITSFCFRDGYDEAGDAVHASGWQISETKVDEKNFYHMCDIVRNGKAFFSREATEARLAELKGGKECR